jgi:hypothetical protein
LKCFGGSGGIAGAIPAGRAENTPMAALRAPFLIPAVLT